MKSNNKIYCIENIINGMQYIGKTSKNIELRFKQHKQNSTSKHCNKTYLYGAFLKYDVNNFKITLIEDVISSDDINKKEIYWIEKHNTLAPNGYNMTKGGDGGNTASSPNFIQSMKVYHNSKSKESYSTSGMLGKTHSKDAKLKQSESRKKYWDNPENRAKRKDNSGVNNPMSKTLIINDIIFVSLASASRELKLSETHLRSQIKKQGSRNLKLPFSN